MWYEMNTLPENAADWSVEYERERSRNNGRLEGIADVVEAY